MYFALVGLISPFIIISMRGDEINKAHKASGALILFILYALGILFF